MRRRCRSTSAGSSVAHRLRIESSGFSIGAIVYPRPGGGYNPGMDAPAAETKPKSPWPNLIGLAILFALAAWLVLVGHHRHRLTFKVNGKTVALVSRKSPWVVER